MLFGYGSEVQAKKVRIVHYATDEEWKALVEQLKRDLITCAPEREWYEWVEVEDETDTACVGITYTNEASTTFLVGSEDASSMKVPFNAWYDILSQLIFGKAIPEDEWNKDAASEEFSKLLAQYNSGKLSEKQANEAFEELARYIMDYANKTLGKKIEVTYEAVRMDGGKFSEDGYLDMNGQKVKPTYISASGKTAIFKTNTTIKGTQEETIKEAWLCGTGMVNLKWESKTWLELNGEKTVGMDGSAADGYQIRYSTDKSFKKNSKTITVKNGSATSKKFSGLKKGKTYYFQVRAYDEVGGKKSVCDWSSKKKVKVTK